MSNSRSILILSAFQIGWHPFSCRIFQACGNTKMGRSFNRFSRLAINEVHNGENLRSFYHFSRLAINEVHNGGNFHR